MKGIWKTKYRGYKRLWRENLSFFNRDLNDPEKDEFYFVHEMENEGFLLNINVGLLIFC